MPDGWMHEYDEASGEMHFSHPESGAQLRERPKSAADGEWDEAVHAARVAALDGGLSGLSFRETGEEADAAEEEEMDEKDEDEVECDATSGEAREEEEADDVFVDSAQKRIRSATGGKRAGPAFDERRADSSSFVELTHPHQTHAIAAIVQVEMQSASNPNAPLSQDALGSSEAEAGEAEAEVSEAGEAEVDKVEAEAEAEVEAEAGEGSGAAAAGGSATGDVDGDALPSLADDWVATTCPTSNDVCVCAKVCARPLLARVRRRTACSASSPPTPPAPSTARPRAPRRSYYYNVRSRATSWDRSDAIEAQRSELRLSLELIAEGGAAADNLLQALEGDDAGAAADLKLTPKRRAHGTRVSEDTETLDGLDLSLAGRPSVAIVGGMPHGTPRGAPHGAPHGDPTPRRHISRGLSTAARPRGGGNLERVINRLNEIGLVPACCWGRLGLERPMVVQHRVYALAGRARAYDVYVDNAFEPRFFWIIALRVYALLLLTAFDLGLSGGNAAASRPRAVARFVAVVIVMVTFTTAVLAPCPYVASHPAPPLQADVALAPRSPRRRGPLHPRPPSDPGTIASIVGTSRSASRCSSSPPSLRR